MDSAKNRHAFKVLEEALEQKLDELQKIPPQKRSPRVNKELRMLQHILDQMKGTDHPEQHEGLTD